MGLTITNLNTLTLLNVLNQNTARQATLIKQLTTGRRINTGKDDPAGLIALSSLEAELTAVNQSLINNQRTDSILTVADGALGEIQTLLGEVQSLALQSTSSANLTSAEIAANQSQIDDALAAIDRIVRTTNFNGKKLLDGAFSILTTGATGNANISDLRVFSRSQSTSDTAITVSRVASAQTASATFAFADANSVTSGTTTVAITGNLGTATLTLTSGLTQTEIVAAINGAKDLTGVSAVQAATFVGLSSAGFGTDSFISVEVLSGGILGDTAVDNNTANTGDNIQSSSKVTGTDATITINGQTAGTDGLDVNFSGAGLSFAFTLGTDFGRGNTAATTTTFTVKAAGGATFQLGTDSTTRVTIGIDSLSTFKLGGGNGTKRLSELKAGGAVALKTDVAGALDAVRAAITEVASVRGRVGGFQKFQVGSAINALQASQTGLQQAVSQIADTDFAVATAELNQKNVLIQTSIALLGLSNQQSSLILSLLV